MRILVTGAGGFIGSQVTRLLVQEGDEVYGVIRDGGSRERVQDFLNLFHFVPLDLKDSAAVRAAISDIRPECAIHLAWYAVPGNYWTATENLDCVALSLALAQGLAEAGCKRLVVAGSCAEYDWDHAFLSEETTPLKPRTLYGVCKNALHMMLEEYCARESMELSWARFFYLYGPGEQEQRLVPSVTLALLRGQIAQCAHGEQIRDFLHITDAASALCAVAKSGLIGPVNIGSGEPTKLRTVVETIAHSVGCPERVAVGTPAVEPAEPTALVADVLKIRQGTSWTPRLTLPAGIEQTVTWWRANGTRVSA